MSRFTSSFRDPSGCCCSFQGRIFRLVGVDAIPQFETFLESKFARNAVASKQFVSTRRLNDAQLIELRQAPDFTRLFPFPASTAVYEHDRIPFASYPHEWPPEMLWAAGNLTLELAQAALKDGYLLKDATPYNVLFRGSSPVFVDALSFDRADPHNPLWMPDAQFNRTFSLPLLANRRWQMRLADIFTTHRDGIELEDVYRYCGKLERLNPRTLSLVSIPTWLSRSARPDDAKIYQPIHLKNAEKARFILDSLFKRRRRNLQALEPDAHKKSTWSDYMASHSYNDPAFAAKEKFVRDVLVEFKPARVLDVGANTGHFSALAAKSGASVVAVDSDPACVGGIWQRAKRDSLDILPLVIDIARPSPAMGWRNGECPSFLDRAAGEFDGVLMLALIHHLLVAERIPLDEILRLAADLTRSWVVVEFVAPEDDMFRRLTRGRESLHASLTVSFFEQACLRRFDIVRQLLLPGTQRRLYCLKRKEGTP